MMRDFDWNLIKSFLAVVEHETLMRAAQELKTSQPTLGRRITELEQSMGLVLFHRTRSGMRPTDVALSLAEQAKEMQRDADKFATTVTARNQSLNGTVRITASEIVANFVLPRIIAHFRSIEPNIQIDLVSSNQVQNLLARDADIAIRMMRPVQNELIARKATDFAMGAYAHRSYLKNAPRLDTKEDLKRHALLGYDRDDLIIKGMAAAGIKIARSDFAVRTDDQVAYWHLLCAGAGVGFAPRYLARQNDQLEEILQKIAIPSLPMWLTSHHELKTNLAIRRTMDFLHEALVALRLNS